METDTLILMGLLVTALGWFFAIHIKDERKKYIKEEQDKLERANRIRRFTTKL